MTVSLHEEPAPWRLAQLIFSGPAHPCISDSQPLNLGRTHFCCLFRRSFEAL